MAAEGYARVHGKPGVAMVTGGPGGINALNGLYGAFADSLPVFVVAGLAKSSTVRACHDPELVAGLRQMGVQEADVPTMAKPVTKYATTVKEPFLIRYEMEKAWHLATSGRPGPVFLDVPLDVQAAAVDAGTLEGYHPQLIVERPFERRMKHLLEQLDKAERPVLVGGEGVREDGPEAVAAFRALAEKLAIPVVTAWMPDLYPTDRPFYIGRLGTNGTRAGNFAVQNADLVLAVGSRLSIPQVSFNWENFVRQGIVVSVNVDAAELHKPIRAADDVWHMAPGTFSTAMIEEIKSREWDGNKTSRKQWLKWCRERKERYPEFALKHQSGPAGINPYHFVQQLFSRLPDDAFVACGNAMAGLAAFMTAPIRGEQRLTSNASAGSMGHDLPSAIGVAAALGGREVTCIAGEGSVMMNLQELQTVAHYNMPIRLFIFNNGGYQSMRGTQKGFFGRTIGESPESGVSFPDFSSIAHAFGLPGRQLSQKNFPGALVEILEEPAPLVCEVLLDPAVNVEPRLASHMRADGFMVSDPLEDLSPRLPHQEFLENMIIIPIVDA